MKSESASSTAKDIAQWQSIRVFISADYKPLTIL